MLAFPNLFSKQNEYTYIISAKRIIRDETFEKIRPMIDNISKCVSTNKTDRTPEQISLANRQIDILDKLLQINLINGSSLQALYKTINDTWG